MKKEQTRIKLKQLYHELAKLKISKNSENNTLNDIINNINLLDSYYAGLALSVSEGQKISKNELYDIESLINSLNFLEIYKEQDSEILVACRSFLTVIGEIDNLLRKIAN